MFVVSERILSDVWTDQTLILMNPLKSSAFYAYRQF